MASTRIEEHQREVARIQRAIRTANSSAVRETILAVQIARNELRAELESVVMRAGSSSIEAGHLRDLLQAVDLTVLRLNARLRAGMTGHIAGMMQLGTERVPRELNAAGLRVELPGLDPMQLQMVQQYSMSLVAGVSADAQSRLRGVMFRSAMGRQTPWEAQLDIAKVLGTDPKRLHWGSIMAQADRLYRTEGLRGANVAHAERMKQAALRMPGATKMWLHGSGGKDPRPEHVHLNGKAIPVADDFVWTDKKGIRYEAFGPYDPRLPASQVINCTCTTVLIPAGGAAYDDAIGNRIADLTRNRIAQDWQRALDAELRGARDAQDDALYFGDE